jgi:hypothetical protein
VQGASHHARVVKEPAVGQHVVAFDDLAFFAAVSFGNDPAATESQPLDEVVERLALVGGCLDYRSQFGVAEVLEQEPGPHRDP